MTYYKLKQAKGKKVKRFSLKFYRDEYYVPDVWYYKVDDNKIYCRLNNSMPWDDLMFDESTFWDAVNFGLIKEISEKEAFIEIL